MRFSNASWVLTIGCMCASLTSLGQTPAVTPTANPLDAIPEAMPFDVPYGAPISADRAETLINLVVAEANKHRWKFNISVVDSGANLVAFRRMDGAQLASIQVSQHKARSAALYRRETRTFEDGIQLKQNYYTLSLDGMIASRGGIPLVENGKIIGAIGCSGGTGSQDELVCKAAAGTVK